MRVHVQGSGGLPLEFSWRGRRHRVRTVLGADQGRYSVRTASGMRCTLALEAGRGFWQIEQISA